MQFKNILFSIIASAALINAVAIPADKTPTTLDPTADPAYITCVDASNAYRIGTHLPTAADKAEGERSCRTCIKYAYRACKMTAPSSSGGDDDCFTKSMKHCKAIQGAGPPAAKPAAPVDAPVPIKDGPELVKREIVDTPRVPLPGSAPGGPGKEPKLGVPAGLTGN